MSKSEILAIERIAKKGDISTDFYAISSSLLIQSMKKEDTGEGREPMVTTMQYSDYQDYDGLQMPSKITMNVGGQNIELKVKSMQINAKLKEKDFVWEE